MMMMINIIIIIIYFLGPPGQSHRHENQTKQKQRPWRGITRRRI